MEEDIEEGGEDEVEEIQQDGGESVDSEDDVNGSKLIKIEKTIEEEEE